MSDPIMELVEEYARTTFTAAQRAAIEREVAALRERAELAPCGHPRSLTTRTVETGAELCELCDVRSQRNDAVAMEEKHKQRIADLEAERAALMEAGRLAIWQSLGTFDEVNMAIEVFEEKPGALAAWLAKEGGDD